MAADQQDPTRTTPPTPTPGLGGQQPGDPPAPTPDGDEPVPGAPPALSDAAEGGLAEGEEGTKQEIAVLDFLCGDQAPLNYTVKAQIDTPTGRGSMLFHMRQIDADRIEELTKQHREGEGPFSKVDGASLNASLVAEACRYMTDPTGKKVDPTDQRFIGASIAPLFAFQRAFRFQPGILDMVSAEVRAMAGMAEDRVGRAEREITSAVGNS